VAPTGGPSACGWPIRLRAVAPISDKPLKGCWVGLGRSLFRPGAGDSGRPLCSDSDRAAASPPRSAAVSTPESRDHTPSGASLPLQSGSRLALPPCTHTSGHPPAPTFPPLQANAHRQRKVWGRGVTYTKDGGHRLASQPSALSRRHLAAPLADIVVLFYSPHCTPVSHVPLRCFGQRCVTFGRLRLS
jgi:hypothetical protein